MTRFSGPIGYSRSEEVTDGVWEDVITERNLFGDVLRSSRRLDTGGDVNPDLRVNNSLSVVADAYALEHIYDIRYAVFQNVRWVVSEITVEHPRLILQLGGVYDGPLPKPSDSEDGGTAGAP